MAQTQRGEQAERATEKVRAHVTGTLTRFGYEIEEVGEGIYGVSRKREPWVRVSLTITTTQ